MLVLREALLLLQIEKNEKNVTLQIRLAKLQRSITPPTFALTHTINSQIYKLPTSTSTKLCMLLLYMKKLKLLLNSDQKVLRNECPSHRRSFVLCSQKNVLYTRLVILHFESKHVHTSMLLYNLIFCRRDIALHLPAHVMLMSDANVVFLLSC